MKLARIADRVARDIYRRAIVWTYKDSVIPATAARVTIDAICQKVGAER